MHESVFWLTNNNGTSWSNILNNYGLKNIIILGYKEKIAQVIFLTKRELKDWSEDYLCDKDTSPYSLTTIINEIIT